MTAARIYVVIGRTEGAKQRLVRATHPANALRHVAADSFGVQVAAGSYFAEKVEDAATT